MRISDCSSDVCSSDLRKVGRGGVCRLRFGRGLMGYAFGEPMFKGSMVALITPFRNGAVDEDAFRKLVDFQITNGTHGLVPVGTTGESPTLSHDEHKRVVEICVDEARGRVPVIAGAGSNATAEAGSAEEHAKERPEERRVGKECVSTCRSRGSP